MSVPRVSRPLGKPSPYILPAYEGEALNLAGSKSTIRVLASAQESQGQISVFHMDGVLADPVGFHHHNEAHDIFMCTKGYIKVWAGNQCRTIAPGDFCSVPPGVIHRPQVLGPWTETVGLITPGDWIDFFRCVSDEYTGIMADEFDPRNTLQVMMSKMHLIQERQYDVVFHPHHQPCEESEWAATDTKIPDGVVPYYLRANTGPRFLLGGVLSRPFITTRQTAGKFAITSIESSHLYGASVLNHPFTMQSVHQIYHVLDGAINVTIDGEANVVRVGETIFIPAGTKIQITFVEKYTRFWAFASGDGLEALVENAGSSYEGYIIPDKPAQADQEHVRKIARTLDIMF